MGVENIWQVPAETVAYGVFSRPGEDPRIGLRLDDRVVDLALLSQALRLELLPAGNEQEIFTQHSLNEFMALGREACRHCLGAVSRALAADSSAVEQAVVPLATVQVHLPFDVRDFVDFYASKHHAVAAGRLIRPGSRVPQHWPYIPIGYHSRAASVVVSQAPVRRPRGQLLRNSGATPVYQQTQKLDFELELGFVVGSTSDGSPVPPERALDLIFGVVLLNDWSARDIQTLESQPLGPFLGKAFATSISPWVVPLQLLLGQRVAIPDQEPPPLAHLNGSVLPKVFDIPLRAAIKSSKMSEHQTICETNARHLYWSVEQQVAHLTSGGATLRTGDLLGTGTISGPDTDSRACLLELTANGKEPLALGDGTFRTYLQDGDEILLSGRGLGEVVSRVVPASPVSGSENASLVGGVHG